MHDLRQDNVVMETTASHISPHKQYGAPGGIKRTGQCEWLQGVGCRISEGGGGCLFWWLPGRLSEPTPPHTHTHTPTQAYSMTDPHMQPIENVTPVKILFLYLRHVEPSPAYDSQIFSSSRVSVFWSIYERVLFIFPPLLPSVWLLRVSVDAACTILLYGFRFTLTALLRYRAPSLLLL